MVASGKSEYRSPKSEVAGGLGLALLVALFALALTCRKWDNPLDPTGNHPPTVPSHPHPADSGIGTNVGLVLSWQSQDPDSGDTAYFKVFFDTVSSPHLVKDSCTTTAFQPDSVDYSAEYYWRVIAYDNHGDSAVGPLWQFQAVSPLTVTAPDSGDRLRMYSTDTITWTGGPSGARRTSGGSRIVLRTDGVRSSVNHAVVSLAAADSIVIQRSTDDGVSWIRLGRATTPGQFAWQVPAPATEYARVKVVAYASTDTITGTSGRFAVEDSAAARSRGSR